MMKVKGIKEFYDDTVDMWAKWYDNEEMLPFLTYEKTKYSMFVCGAKPEFKYIEENFSDI